MSTTDHGDKEAFLPNMDLELHGLTFTRSLRVKWTAAELGVLDRLKTIDVQLMTGEHRRADFKQVNVMAQVPVLTLRDRVSGSQLRMTESAAICRFLTDQMAHTTLQPPLHNVFARAQYERFITFAAAAIDPLLFDIRMHEEVLPEEQRVPRLASKGREAFADKILKVLEEALGDCDWICGEFYDEFTTADVVVGYACMWADRYKLLEESPIVKAYLKRVTKRPAFIAAVPKSSGL